MRRAWDWLVELLGALLCLLGLHDWQLGYTQHVAAHGRPYDVRAEVCVRPGCRGVTDRVRVVPGAWPWVQR
ncbi:hypothetical protein [Nocardioides sp.]|uniref:hypothetical protein n=1 Tax=Nocardioides sp. TaxID=35761 RepID=UPI0035B095D7